MAGFCTARVIAADVAAAEPYIVSEYVDGPSLRRAIAERGPLDQAQPHRFGTGIATALTAIHMAEVVHRDLGLGRGAAVRGDRPAAVRGGDGAGGLPPGADPSTGLLRTGRDDPVPGRGGDAARPGRGLSTSTSRWTLLREATTRNGSGSSDTLRPASQIGSDRTVCTNETVVTWVIDFSSAKRSRAGSGTGPSPTGVQRSVSIEPGMP
ncbi:hypothetical protein OIE67_16825 [Nonomuraea fuscirosea]|uniref:hypothetical protein n=1 Tax=Nonomuraea fuscirosea TaxID=1291556 RepID=UPI002DDB9E00|nr:hypothetical protein [Nonomuraea fuscirosea]WSA56202.1 hypothetical protein OIE67_16825 [Nonomuraea fuscirosea]